jgi:hypothetical protein
MNTKLLVKDASGRVVFDMLTDKTGGLLNTLRDRLLKSVAHGKGETLEMYTQQTDLTFKRVW